MQKFIVISVLTTVLGWDSYPHNPQIHIFGNHGLLGRLHAEVAPLFTRLIDDYVYECDIRVQVLDSHTCGRRVLDLGCGVGYSTSRTAGSLGIDTSVPMIEKARRLFPEKEFEHGRAEWWCSCDREFDVVTIMYMFHEAPQSARRRIVERAKLIAKEKVLVVDISPDYVPSSSMLAGEPYLMDYLSNVRVDLCEFLELELVPGHVNCWIYDVQNRG